MLSFNDLKEFLDEKHNAFNRPSFIETDPIQIPHQFTKKEDIEIAAFLTSQIAWGNRKMIIKNAETLMKLMCYKPYDFILNFTPKENKQLEGFAHRTFNSSDLIYFCSSLQNIYTNHKGLEAVFTNGFQFNNTIYSSIKHFREVFFELKHEQRVKKHIADVTKNSAAKRINLFLMWMVRNDNRGVHFGLWKGIPASSLKLPLDIHSGNTSRALKLLNRKQNDWKAVEEITENLKKFDEADPVKYDFALFGLGVFEKFNKI
jgi:uncharacterized protein (TIGR02757 family)